MKTAKLNKGFSIIELLVVMGIMAILSAIAVPSLTSYYRSYKYREYAYSMETLVRWSRLTAMEKTANIGLCVDRAQKTLNIVDMGASRSDVCRGNTLKRFTIEDDFISIKGSSAAFDPRSFAIYAGNVCLMSDSKFYKVVISRFGAIRIERGKGECS
ncbi:MAG TPA: prepilin-type N-terminal cleavage/methylation domain-containing protein [Smithellaceae bacterium]|nr:prepilin-type N-terminal cleavage/methylation domain-containing protein [Smithellaceae bacterium]